MPAFQHYKTGVFTSNTCGTKLDHGVLVVGYGSDTTSNTDYWIVKNSWGAVWGDAGYIKIERDGTAKGLCGINMQPSYPKAGKGPSPGPSPPPAPGGECAVSRAERHRCGFVLSKTACEAKGCCFDDTHPFADHCFHPKSGPAPGPPPPPTPPPARRPRVLATTATRTPARARLTRRTSPSRASPASSAPRPAPRPPRARATSRPAPPPSRSASSRPPAPPPRPTAP